MLSVVGASALTIAACGSAGSSSGGGPDGSLGDSSLMLGGDTGASLCTPKSCKDLGYTCGKNGDTCGGIVDCGACASPEYCGGGGYSKCGGNIGQAPDGAPYCTPKTCADFPTGTCGFQSDGCGGTTAGSCGSCPSGQYCGGGGNSLCGTGTDGGPGSEAGICTPKTCADFPAGKCGRQSDGCGGLTPDCAAPSCPSGQFCGGGGPGLCGSGPAQDGGPGGGGCTPFTCANLGNPCGAQGDGCGGMTAVCTTCPSGQWCGGGGPNQCGNGFSDGGSSGGDSALIQPCVPKSCSNYPAGTCGPQSDGCGGLTANCNPCPAGQFCGGGGAGQCGNGLSSDAGTCNPWTCSHYPANACGAQSDGCGGLTANCNATCPGNQYCGGGGPGLCGTGPLPDAGVCTPKTCANFPGTCGQHSDGCGGLTANCGTCPGNQYCGGGGPGVCGGGTAVDGGVCTPWTCSHYPGTCGQHSDGCGGLTANCGTCTNPQFCGGGGAGVCGGNNGLGPDGGPTSNCVKATCQSLGYTCGQASDGCGGTIGPCGPTCTLPLVCGGGGPSKPNVCGSNLPCTGLCTQQVQCDGGATTTLTGTVVASTLAKYLPAGVQYGDPVPDVLVYIPTTTPSAFVPRAMETTTQQCTVCGADVTGNPLVTATTGYDGTFSLANVPVGNNIPLVIQLGRWRRQFTVNINNTCGVNQANAAGMPVGILKMPNNQGVGDIPLTAISTGQVDAMECVLLKMGIDAAEFTDSAAVPNGRVHIYQGNGAVSTTAGAATPNEVALMGKAAPGAVVGTWNNYDQMLFPCWGAPITKTATELANLITYADTGGHFFATHFSYTWLNTNAEFQGTAVWDTGANGGINSMTGVVSPLPPTAHPAVFVKWLNYVHALANFTAGAPPVPANVTIANARHDVDTVSGNSTSWITGTDPNPGGNSPATMLLHYTFDTPVTPPVGGHQCGHAIYSDFHVANSATTGVTCQVNADCTISNSCSGAGAACARNRDCASGSCNGNGKCDGLCAAASFPSQADVAAYCAQKPMTAQEKILEFMIWDLSSCVPPQQSATCTPMTCAAFPAGTCGQQGDGCGGLTPNCGTCAAGQTCGGGGIAGQCGAIDAGTCTVQTCSAYPVGTCGPQADGCGALTASCNNCPPGQSCGGGGVAGVCGAPPSSCQPQTCASYPAGTCGQQSDGCGGLTANCACPAGQSCGGAGVAGQCGTPPSCTPLTCASYPAGTCGQQSDGCGGLTTNCACPAGQSCGGGGVSGQCGAPPDASSCMPLTCAAYTGVCGQQSDGCGSLTNNCNPCAPPATCGGGGVAGQCGTPPDASSCIPQTCSGFPGICGVQSDGCGGLTPYCNPCTPPATCGGGGTPGACGSPAPPTCTKLTCAAYPTGTCGQQSDGCGGLTVDCNPCTPPATCGGGGTAGQCGTPPVGTCVPKTCNDYPGICGQQSDGCGALTPFCNPCTPPATCGGGGTAGQCGTPPVGTCVPKTCNDYPGICGQQSDGCGALTPFCNPCTPPATCGGGGTTGVCGTGGTCTPQTCAALGFNCGPAGDGCGGLQQCGTCPAGQTCGANGHPGVCSGNVPQ